MPSGSCFTTQDGQRQIEEYRSREGCRYDNRCADLTSLYHLSDYISTKKYSSYFPYHRCISFPSVNSGSTYCTRQSAKAYSENRETHTKEELRSLLRTIHENPNMPNKEKRRLLAQFYKGHPDIFVQYFGNKLSSMNMLLQ